MTGVGRLQAKRTGGHEPTVNVAVRIAQSGHRKYFRNGHRCRGRRSAGCQLTVAFDLSEKYRHLLGGPRAKAMEKFETVVIGGGQAGLAMSHHLAVLGCEHVIFERARVAERWRSQRWDSLMFQFPNWSIELPGRAYSTGNPDGFARSDEVLRFIEDYCAWIKAPIRTGANVSAVRAQPSAGGYEIISDMGPVAARNVVIATGPYQRPRLPTCHRSLPSGVVQVHAAAYRNPAALPDGAVLVVGSGASGCQIADELLESGRRVYLSIGQHRRVPRRYRGRDVFWWRRELGELDQTVDTTPASRRMPAPLVTGVHGGYDIAHRTRLRWFDHTIEIRRVYSR